MVQVETANKGSWKIYQGHILFKKPLFRDENIKSKASKQ